MNAFSCDSMEPNLYHILNISISSRPAIYMLRIYESACVKLWVVPISSLSDSTTLTSVLGAFSALAFIVWSLHVRIYGVLQQKARISLG